MGTHTIELNAKELVKLISICNTAIVFEEETLKYLSTGKCREICNASIAEINAIKEKVKQSIYECVKGV